MFPPIYQTKWKPKLTTPYLTDFNTVMQKLFLSLHNIKTERNQLDTVKTVREYWSLTEHVLFNYNGSIWFSNLA